VLADSISTQFLVDLSAESIYGMSKMETLNTLGELLTNSVWLMLALPMKQGWLKLPMNDQKKVSGLESLLFCCTQLAQIPLVDICCT
jgi:hypothetical protein